MPNKTLLRVLLISVALILATFVGGRFALGAEQSSPANGRLVVRVVDGSGAPQADAIVKAFIIKPAFRQLVDIGRESHCDATGRATFDRLATDEAYFLRATVGNRLVGYLRFELDSDKPIQTVDLRLSAARSATIRVRDERGNAIAGATVVKVSGETPNGRLFWIMPADLSKFGIVAGQTNAVGELTLHMLPEGKMSVQLFHPKYARTDINRLATESGAANDIVMPSGVNVELQFRLPSGVSHIDGLIFWLDNYDTPLPRVPASGKIEMTVRPGSYIRLQITHPDFTVTPEYYKVGKQFQLRSTQNVFTFDVWKTTKVHGRVVDQSTGNPLSGILVLGYQNSGSIEGPFAEFASKWSSVAEQWTDERGRYELPLSAGPAQVSIHHDGMMAQHDCQSIDVAADGSTVVPDIVLRPTPKIRGIVRDPAGQPVPHAVLRFRDSNLLYTDYPIVADAGGRFELAPQRMPTDWTWQKAEPIQTLLAFDPYRPLGAVARVDLSDSKPSGNVEIRLQPQDYAFPVVGFPDEFASFAASTSTEWRAKEAEWARGGAPAPELDGAAWLNTTKPKMSLADFRGKYLLLHFWTTWCGNCPKDMQHLVVAERLYRDRGLAVVCVHDNSVSIAEIKQYVAEHKINFPVVIDRPDGRILAGYNPHGAIGFPTDVLVGPDGRIVGYPPGSHRVIYRIELLRQQLMSPCVR